MTAGVLKLQTNTVLEWWTLADRMDVSETWHFILLFYLVTEVVILARVYNG